MRSWSGIANKFSAHLMACSCLWGLVCLVSALSWPVLAQNFQTTAPYAILIDAQSGTVLFEKAADEQMYPASTVKILAAEVVFHEITEGRLKLTDEFPISEHAWRDGGIRSGGSSMFAVAGSKISVENLLRGMIIQSGNDAAIALAEGIAGSEDAFSTLMNRRADAIGMKNSTFANPWGKTDPDQKVTARDMARLADYVIRTYGDFYHYFGEKDFTWNKIKQPNRNPLLFMDIGADGLKTGDTKESGFGLVGSAVQNSQRLIVVVNGLKTAQERAEESRKLLAWGFRFFEPRTLFKQDESVGTAQVYGGTRSSVNLVAPGEVTLLLARGVGETLSGKILYQGPLVAPIAKGTPIGHLVINRGGRQILDVPVSTAEDIEAGDMWHRAYDGSIELASGWFRRILKKQ